MAPKDTTPITAPITTWGGLSPGHRPAPQATPQPGERRHG